MDVIGREDPPRRARRRRPVDRLAALVGAAAVLTGAAGAVTAQRVDGGLGPAPGQVGADVDGSGSSADAGPSAGPGSSAGSGSAARTGLSARTVGASARPAAGGARGQAVVELRNDGPSVLLLGVTAEVPGVRFTPVELPDGVPLRRGRRVEVRLDFAVADCGRLRRTGRLVVRTSSGGVVAETGLPITHDGEARTLRQADLDVVLRACRR